MEPERDIEKQLRAFAKKRGEQAGDPLELHPATRRLLQGEVARTSPNRSGRGSWFSLSRIIRPGFVYTVCALAIITIGVAMLLPALSRAKFKSRRAVELAKNAKKSEADKAARGDAMIAQAPAVAPPVFEKTPKDAVALRSADLKQKSDSLTSNARQALDKPYNKIETAADNLTAGGPTTNVALDDVGTAAKSLLAVNEPLPGEQVAHRALSAAAPASSAPRSTPGLAGDGFSGGRSPVQFTNAIEPIALKASNGSVRPGSVAVVRPLSSFVLQQSGTNLRVIDGDGSIYSGSVQPQFAAAREGRLTGSIDELRDREVPALLTNRFYFTVSGTNLSLDKHLVFTGTFTAFGSAGNPGLGLNGGTIGFTAIPTNALSPGSITLQLRNSEIQGTAVIGDSNRLEIHALPVPTSSPR